MTVVALSWTGKRWLIGPSRPSPATTAVRPSSSGTSAATSEPNANTSIRSVSGMASSSTRCMLPLTIWFWALMAEMVPVSPVVSQGCARPMAARAARMRAGTAWSSPAVAGLTGWRAVTEIRTECRSAEVVSVTRNPSAPMRRSRSRTAAAKPGSLLTCVPLWR